MRLKFLTATLILFGVFLPFKMYASSAASILVNMAPENPAPGETVTITLNSYVNNLDSVAISWKVDGKTGASGIGKKSFSVTAPAAGSETDVIATVSLPDGPIDTKIIIRPAGMVLLWEADDSYAPPFYKGKPLPTADSEIKVVAMPEIKKNGSFLSPSSLVYAWQKDYSNVPDSSGYGKNFFTYNSDYLDDTNTIGVTASTTDQTYSSQKSVTIGTSLPKIVFYKNDPLLGTLWENALEDGHIINGNEILIAEPYFISPVDIRIPSLVFNWFINDQMIAQPVFNKNRFPVAAAAGATGTSKIKLEVSNTYKLFENASQEINVNF